jgi:phosphatidylserine decarboxylase
MDGSLVIIRLAPADYHRYHFPLAECHLTPRLTVIIVQLTHLLCAKWLKYFCLNKGLTIVTNPVFGNVIMAK